MVGQRCWQALRVRKMTAIVKPSAENIARAARLLANGGLVGLPTETVYGLAADATNGQAVARIFEVKGRPTFNPLISHVTGIEQAETLAHFPEMAIQLAERFWPGPLTFVLPKLARCKVHDLVTAGLPTIALRAPGHAVARQLLVAFGKPIAAPSANPSGELSPTTAQHVYKGLNGDVDLILDGGPCAVGLESTVIEVTNDHVYLLRPGSITKEDLAETTGKPVLAATGTIKSPGQTLAHYAPNAHVRLNAQTADEKGLMLGFGEIDGDLNLSPDGDLREAAANLFAMLHELDARRPKTISIAPIPKDGLGMAINDRLARAASSS